MNLSVPSPATHRPEFGGSQANQGPERAIRRGLPPETLRAASKVLNRLNTRGSKVEGTTESARA